MYSVKVNQLLHLIATQRHIVNVGLQLVSKCQPNAGCAHHTQEHVANAFRPKQCQFDDRGQVDDQLARTTAPTVKFKVFTIITTTPVCLEGGPNGSHGANGGHQHLNGLVIGVAVHMVSDAEFRINQKLMR